MYRNDTVPELGQWDWLGKALDYTKTVAQQVLDVSRTVKQVPAAVTPTPKPAPAPAPRPPAVVAAGIGGGALLAGAAVVGAFLLFGRKRR